jgi:hypothetical protein
MLKGNAGMENRNRASGDLEDANVLASDGSQLVWPAFKARKSAFGR